VFVPTGVIWEGGPRGTNAHPIFYPKQIFLATELKSGKQKKTGVRMDEKGCMYIKDWFNPIFSLVLLHSLI
jgi:hypothetical protein